MKKRKQSYEPLTIEVVAVELERGYMTSDPGTGGDTSEPAATTTSTATVSAIKSNVLF